MDSTNKEASVYSLIGELCKRFFDKHTPEEHPYLPRKDNTVALQRLRARAFEILLKKSTKNHDDNDGRNSDPVAELLKYAFVMKTALKRASKAEELEESLDSLIQDGFDSNHSFYSTLQFLNGLKSLDFKDRNAPTVFHYGRANPLLPEEIDQPKGPPKYQTYPIESFVLPEKFEAMLGVDDDRSVRQNCIDARSNLSFKSQFRSVATLGIETLSSRSEQTIGSMLSVPRYTVRLVSTQEFSMASHFMPELMEDNDEPTDEYLTGHIGRIAEPETAWLCVKSARTNVETNSELSDEQSTIIGFDEGMRNVEISSIVEWDDMIDLPNVKEHRTWESLGNFQAPEEPPFVTETTDAMSHLEIIKQAGFLPLLSRNIVESLNPIVEVPTIIFLENIKLLLLGVESETFVLNENGIFDLRENTTIPGLSAKALRSVCSDLTYWGYCYRSLSILIKPDPQTGKMLQEGLIFLAMCNSVKELLIYYQAVILRITVDSNDDGPPGLLKLITNVRPVGCLIAEVARLCRCDKNDQPVLNEGLGLLSHIYDQVTRVTKPSVALVFYSILKSCCEVYFRFLQKWLFEGTCDDAHGEFMIKIRPQYLREKTHRFWTKGFAINVNSVPGFIGHLAESILDCGKTVRLLKICDPNNVVSSLSTNEHPSVRVCLSVGMVREQETSCREFSLNGEKILGPDVSFSRAFEKHRNLEKLRADLVTEAQRETLARIKREREQDKINVVRRKRELLAELKDQVEEVATRKEREREAELLKDKKFLELVHAAEKIAEDAELAEKKNVLNYYNELAAEAEKRRVRAEWRFKRMKLFQQRVDFVNKDETEFWKMSTKDLSKNLSDFSARNDDRATDEKFANDHVESNVKLDESSIKTSEDENKNSTKTEVIKTSVLEESKASKPTIEKSSVTIEKIDEKLQSDSIAKSSRPIKSFDVSEKTTMNVSDFSTNLNDNPKILKSTNTNSDVIPIRPKDLLLIADENAKIARKNKFKVMHSEYGITPNNNEFNIIVMDAQGNENHISIDAATVDPDNMRITTEINDNKTFAKNDVTTDMEKNRNANMGHYSDDYDEFVRPHRVRGSVNLTDAQINRNKIMGHTYNEICHSEQTTKLDNADYAELRRNRARIMGHEDTNYRDYAIIEESDLIANRVNPSTPTIQQPIQDDGVTPMSCTTDTFPPSMCSSITQLQNFDDDYFSKNDVRNATTPGDLSYDNSESRPSTGFTFPRENNAFKNFFGLETVLTPNYESSLTVADVEMIDNTSLQVYLEKSVTIPLGIQSRLANAAVIKFIINDMNILSHLHSLRSFFFLLNGEFAKSLTGSIYKRLYEISTPIELFQSATLTNILENALNSSLTNSYANSKLLSLSATDIPTQLQVSNPEFLNCLCMNYKISWPLNIVLDERLMQQYSKVFKFLLMVGRVLYVLREDFHLLKIERKAAKSAQYHKLQLYRHSMMQFVTALHNYLTCSVLHASWTEFEKDLENATTLDRIYMIHVNYVKKILSRCMLTARGEKMRNFLCNIFKVILKFHNRVRSQNWSRTGTGYTHANFERLEHMYQTFCEARTYLAHVANKLASSGYQPHLTHFLNALNINPLYDLTGTTGSKKF